MRKCWVTEYTRITRHVFYSCTVFEIYFEILEMVFSFVFFLFCSLKFEKISFFAKKILARNISGAFLANHQKINFTFIVSLACTSIASFYYCWIYGIYNILLLLLGEILLINVTWITLLMVCLKSLVLKPKI